MRDSTFTLQALHYLDLDWEADEFMQFVSDLEPNHDGALQIMYGIDGRRDLAESTLDHLTGYRGARPVRVGNGAFDQRQNDVFGAVLDSILLHTRRSGRLPRGLWPIVQSQAACATEVWREPDQGIWEARGKPQHYVSSKLMGWVALDRAAKLAEIRGDPDLAATWRGTADEIKADILANGVDGRGVLRQHYDTDALDASTLLAAIFGFLPGDDERMHKTTLAIADELSDHGFVLRYRTDETDDGLSGREGTFLICSFWLVSALSIVGESQRALDLMERLLRVASPLDLYAEEFDADTGHHLGNFPQAFSHLALIEAAARIILQRADGGAHMSDDATTSSSSAPAPAVARSPATSHLRASASCCSSGVTGCPANRTTGRPRTCSSTAATSRPTPGTTPRARSSNRRSTTSWAGRPSCTARRCIACVARTSASCTITTASRRRGRSPTTRWSPTTPSPSSTTKCTALAAKIRPSRRRASPTRTQRSRTSRGSSSSPTTSPPPATTPSTRRVA